MSKVLLSIRFKDELQMMDWVMKGHWSRQPYVREMDALDVEKHTGKNYILDGGKDTSELLYLKVVESHTKSVQTESGRLVCEENITDES